MSSGIGMSYILMLLSLYLPPSLPNKDKSNPNLVISHSMDGPLSFTMTFYNSFATPFGSPLVAPSTTSFRNTSLLSGFPFVFWVTVAEPFIPEVAFVEFPPQKGFLSIRVTFAPFYNAMWAAESPANPPPTTITC
jgi:hypothetical protein